MRANVFASNVKLMIDNGWDIEELYPKKPEPKVEMEGLKGDKVNFVGGAPEDSVRVNEGPSTDAYK